MEPADLLAREAIRDLVARYNAYGDSGLLDRMLACSPDAVLEVGDVAYEGPGDPGPLLGDGRPQRRRRGRADLRAPLGDHAPDRPARPGPRHRPGLLHRADPGRPRPLGPLPRRLPGGRRGVALRPPPGLHRRLQHRLPSSDRRPAVDHNRTCFGGHGRRTASAVVVSPAVTPRVAAPSASLRRWKRCRRPKVASKKVTRYWSGRCPRSRSDRRRRSSPSRRAVGPMAKPRRPEVARSCLQR